MMGVDIQIYRCRIGMYDCGLGAKVSDKSMVFRDVAYGVSTVSAVCFIGILLIMTGIEPNPGPNGTHDRNNPLCKNWNRVAYGYRYLETGLTGFISSQVGRRHNILKQKVDQQCHDVNPCSGCTTLTLLPDHGTFGCNQDEGSICLCQQDPGTRQKCPNNFCGRFYHLIVNDHVDNSPLWSSTDPTKWYDTHFQYAKCFLSTDSSANSVSDLDCTDLLTIVIHNCYIRDSIHEVESFQQCLKDHYRIFYSGSFEVTDSELVIYSDNMIRVLEDITYLITNTDAQQAVNKLHELKNDQIQISDEDINGLLNKSDKTFIFRYLFLLIEIGTKVLRHVFDDKVGQDFGRYLTSNRDKKNKLEGDKLHDLINDKTCKRITAAQAKFLPPIDKNPSSSKFDITLLVCLLRNVCGMRPSGDPVWMNPNDNDYSTEADITRLRNCRNERKFVWWIKWPVPLKSYHVHRIQLSHRDIVSISKIDFNAKWDELCRILNRLNQGLTANKITNLPSSINNSRHLCIDENKLDDINAIIDAWKKMDGDVIEVVEQSTARIEHKIERVMDSVQEVLKELQQGKNRAGDAQSADIIKQGTERVLDTVPEPLKEVKKPRVETETGDAQSADIIEQGTERVLDTVQEALKEVKKPRVETKTVVKQSADIIEQGMERVLDTVPEALKYVEKHRAETETVVEQSADIIEQGKERLLDTVPEALKYVKKPRVETETVDEQSADRIERGMKGGVDSVQEPLKEVKTSRVETKTVVKQRADRIEERMKRMLDSLQEALKEVNRKPRVETETDIQQELKDKYMLNCTTITVSPLFGFENEELLELYKIPTFFLTECNGTQPIQKDIEVTSCKQIFYKEDQLCRNIYITGDAGVGKTSFCQFLCLIWYKSKSCIDIVNEEMKEFVDFIGKFDFVFYITLRDSDRIDVIAMIVDQLLFNQSPDEWIRIYRCIKDILKTKECLVILDGLDEWKPDARGKKDISIPSRPFSEKCFYLTTCRPYKTENLLLHKDLDHQVKIAGITGKSSNEYIEEIVRNINKKNGENKDPERFKTEVMECGLGDLLCIPTISSNLIVVWFEQKLTNMSRTLIYGNIVDMLFEMAVKREIEFPLSTASELQLHVPDSLSKLNYMNKHVLLLQKVCLLSFRSLFNQYERVTSLVFTRQQLGSDPYFLYPEQMDLLCKIGILSENKKIGRCRKQEQKLNFLHLSYLELFAALFVSSFDRDNIFNDIVVKNWTSLNQVLPFKNFFLFLAGFSIQTVDQLFRTISPLISNDLTVIRRNTIFHYLPDPYYKQLKSLQSIVISCIKESRRSSDENVFIKLEDLYFEDNSNMEILKPLIELNKTCIKSLYSVNGKYFDIFDQIKHLQCLNVGKVLPADYKKFTWLILENKSTLHTVCIKGDFDTKPLIPQLPVRSRLSLALWSKIGPQSLQHLTSLSLSRVKMQHNSLHNLVKFLSDNVLIENVTLWSVDCNNHRGGDSDCTLTLKLPHHTKFTSLDLWDVNILCNNVNTSSLKSIILGPRSERIVSCYIDVFNCIRDSQLEYLRINGGNWLDNNAVKTLIHTVNTLPYIKVLTLSYIKLPDDVLLQLHPHVTQVEIQLRVVTMSSQYFHSFIENFVNNKTVIKVQLYKCKLTSVDGETHRELSVEESLDYMSEYLTSIPTVIILYKDRYKRKGLDGLMLIFETTSCQ